ncbi:GTP-binding protein, putative [Babesia caballi]|uniref:GTP-binding protein, putative n=1 Tax=Babesia caballi TaxID=5871 RepID=A0AAV4LW41_BABCB|nr:GTP-binding protein, putative [Babesia caballi]
MLYTKKLLYALQQLKPQGGRSVPLSDNTLKEVILKAIGKPTSSDEMRYFKRNNKAKQVAPCFAGEIRPRLKLMTCAVDHSELPPATLPEVAFYGRTNSGKSCLVNSICGRYGVCTVKDLPGTTRKLHFYKVGSPPSIILVDMPGYGYSSAKEDLTVQWNEFSLSYLKHRESLKLVVILVDSRVGLKQSDLEVINFCDKHRIRWQVVLAKADTMKPVLLAKMIHKVRLETSAFRASNGKVIAVSATKNQNLDELRAVVDAFKVDKHMAHLYARSRDKLKSDGVRKPYGIASNEIPTIQRGITHNGTGRLELDTQTDSAPLEQYDLWQYIKETRNAYGPDQVVLKCVAGIFAKMKPPPGLIVDFTPKAESTLTVDTSVPILKSDLTPTYVEVDGNFICDLHVKLEDTLTLNEEPEVKQENLIQDKIASYQRRLSLGMEPVPRIGRPNIGRSYKRVLSIYRKALAPKKLQWNAADREKLTWSATYQKWERWSKKHPQLAREASPPTKRLVVAEGRFVVPMYHR